MSEPSNSAPSSSVAPTAPRADMIQSAVSFLADPKVQSSPISQRISFLESKGLTQQEIDLAMGQVGRAVAGPMGSTSAQGPYMQPYPMMPAYPPTKPQRDWRDWFIMAVVSGTVGYGVISLARRYLYPHLQPPNQTALEEERDALTAKYDEVALHLEELEQTTEAMSKGLAEQQSAIEESVRGVNDMVAESRAREEQRDKDLDQMKKDIEEMRDEFAGMFDRSRKTQQSALADLQTELKSLRSLLVSRGGLSTPTPGVTTPPTASASDGKNAANDAATSTPPARPAPTIPAWQLADSTDD